MPNVSPTEVTTGVVSIKSEPPPFYALAISPDGKTALVEFNNKILAWDLITNQQTTLKINPFFQNINLARISLDGQTGVTTSYKQSAIYLKVWDLTTGNLKAEKRAPSASQYKGFNDLVLSRDRIIGSTDEGVKVWNLQTAELEATLNREKIRYLVVSSDGKLLAGITGDAYYRNTKIRVLQRP